jgi:hypothetical protein
VRERLWPVARRERVRLVGQHDKAGPASVDAGELDARVALGMVAVDVVQAQPGGDITGEGA